MAVKSMCCMLFALSLAAIATSSMANGADRPDAEKNGNAETFANALDMTEAKIFTSPKGAKMPYRLHVPAKPEAGKQYPLVLHMHGMGSIGTNNVDQIKTGGADFLRWAKKRGEEFIFVAPQCPKNGRWVKWQQPADASYKMQQSPTTQLRMAFMILDEVMAGYPVDPERIYVIGISMGGFATWEMLERRPELFAAALPCCGGGDPTLASRLVDIPIWAFHGDRDKSVPVRRTRDMVDAIKAACGKKIEYREYPGMGHNVWTPTFTDDSVFDWLWRQRRQKNRLVRPGGQIQ